MESRRVQILDETVCISHIVNNLEKKAGISHFPAHYCGQIKLIGLFKLGRSTGLVGENAESKPAVLRLKIDLSHSTFGGGGLGNNIK